MSFQIFWERGQVEYHLRVDAANEQEARETFKRMYPRRVITKVKDVTNFVRSGMSCW